MVAGWWCQLANAVLQYVRDPAVRRQTMVGLYNADAANVPVLAALVRKRAELATAAGSASYPHYAAKTRVITDPTVSSRGRRGRGREKLKVASSVSMFRSDAP